MHSSRSFSARKSTMLSEAGILDRRIDLKVGARGLIEYIGGLRIGQIDGQNQRACAMGWFGSGAILQFIRGAGDENECVSLRARSSHRHAHTRQDEFIYVLRGEVELHTDAGREVLRAACAPASRRGPAIPPLRQPIRRGRAAAGHRRASPPAIRWTIQISTCEGRMGPGRRYVFAHKDGTPY